jgi:hypothetical protein
LRPATGLAFIIGSMELSAAKKASLLVGLLGEIAIDFLQELE